MTFFQKLKALLVGSGEVGGFQKPNQQVLAQQHQQRAAHDLALAKEREEKQFQKIKEEEVARAQEKAPVQES